MSITSMFPKRMPVARSTHLRLQIVHVGRLCRGSKPFSAKDQKDWQAAWFGQHMPNRCHPRKAAACELGLWLSSPGHSKPGGALGWQCLRFSTLFITLLNLPAVAAQLNPPAFLKNLRALAVQIVTGKPVHTYLLWFAAHVTCNIAVSQPKLTSDLAHAVSRLPAASAKWLLKESGSGAFRSSTRLPSQEFL